MYSALFSTHWLDEQGTLHVQRACFSLWPQERGIIHVSALISIHG